MINPSLNSLFSPFTLVEFTNSLEEQLSDEESETRVVINLVLGKLFEAIGMAAL